MIRSIDKFLHKTLGRPFKLKCTINEGDGVPVILLHGIGATGNVWQHVVVGLRKLPVQILAFDLLGFGESAKPDYISYNADDHARAVIASIEAQNLGQPVVLVGHSMGCLVAARVARLRPDLVRHLVLYEMPLYAGLPNTKRYKLRLDLYRRFYNKVINYTPSFDSQTIKLAERLGRRVVGFEVTEETWLPFIRSLENTIVNQTTDEDLKQINAPIDVIYGTFDMFVIRGEQTATFGEDSDHVRSHKLRTIHAIFAKPSRFIVERIAVALNLVPTDNVRSNVLG